MPNELILVYTGLSFTTNPGNCDCCNEDTKHGFVSDLYYMCQDCAYAWAISNELFHKELEQ